MNVEIRRVASPRQLKRFIRFPYSLYRDDPYWVPPLDADELARLRRDRNPAFAFCEAEYWIAWRNGTAAGRIAGIVNHEFNRTWGEKTARFGWFDCIEELDVAEALLRTVEEWARSREMDGLCGPLGFTDLDREGMLIEGFDRAGTYATIYNRPYYPRFMEQLGYTRDIDWIEFLVTTPAEIPAKVARVQEIVRRRNGFRVHQWRRGDLTEEFALRMLELMDRAYRGLYGTYPLSEAQKRFYARTYRPVLDPRFTTVILDGNDEIAGFAVVMPSLSRAARKARGRLLPLGWFHFHRALRKPELLDMCLVAVDPRYQDRGVISLIMYEITKGAIAAGVRYSETNVELETNVKVHGLWNEFDAVRHKRRRAYRKALASVPTGTESIA